MIFLRNNPLVQQGFQFPQDGDVVFNVLRAALWIGHWEDAVYVTFVNYDSNARLLEDDIVDIYGVITGTRTYSTLVGENTVPAITVEYIELSQ